MFIDSSKYTWWRVWRNEYVLKDNNPNETDLNQDYALFAEDIIYDMASLADSDRAHTTAAMTRKSRLESFLPDEVLPAGVTPHSTAAFECLCQLFYSRKEKPPVAWIYIHIQADTISAALCRKNSIIYSRSFFRVDVASGKQVASKITDTAEFYRKADKEFKPQKIYVLDEGGNSGQLDFTSNCPVEWIRPEDVQQALNLKSPDNENEYPPLAVCGYAFNDRRSVNLLDRPRREMYLQRRTRDFFLRSFFYFVFCASCVLTWALMDVTREAQTTARFSDALRKIKIQSSRLSRQYEFLNQVKTWQAGAFRPEIFYDIQTALPEGIYIKTFSFDSFSGIILEGSAIDERSLSDFQTALNETGYFQEVRVDAISLSGFTVPENGFRLTLILAASKNHAA